MSFILIFYTIYIDFSHICLTSNLFSTNHIKKIYPQQFKNRFLQNRNIKVN